MRIYIQPPVSWERGGASCVLPTTKAARGARAINFIDHQPTGEEKTMHVLQIGSKLLLALAMTAGLAIAANAASEEATYQEGDQNMTVDEAADNFVDDSKKVGDKAEEVGDDIADEAEKAYDSTKDAVEKATE